MYAASVSPPAAVLTWRILYLPAKLIVKYFCELRSLLTRGGDELNLCAVLVDLFKSDLEAHSLMS